MTSPAQATTLRFDVSIDQIDIGSFTGLEGLSAKYEVVTYAEGGENGFVHQLPGRLSYGNVRLIRPVRGRSQAGLTRWFRDLSRGELVRHTASIRAYDETQQVVAGWSFDGVWPVSYVGPNFSVDGGKVATEIFEFAHDGFTEEE